MSSSFLSQTEIEELLSRLNPDSKGRACAAQSRSKGEDEQLAQVSHQSQPDGEDTALGPACGPDLTAGVTAPPAEVRHAQAQLEVERVSFPELQAARLDGRNSLQLFYDTPVTLVLELGSAVLRVGEVLALQKNSVIKLDRLAGENVTLLVNGRPLASGEVVVINENFGFRVTAVGNSDRETAEKG